MEREGEKETERGMEIEILVIVLYIMYIVMETHLPGGVVVSEVDEVLHEPGVDLTQSQALVWGLQNGLGTEHSSL